MVEILSLGRSDSGHKDKSNRLLELGKRNRTLERTMEIVQSFVMVIYLIKMKAEVE